MAGKKQNSGGEVNRLNDIVVEEVSLVDRAANQRKFLVVKREGGMAAGAEIVASGSGFTTTDKAKEKPGEPKKPGAQAAPPPPAPTTKEGPQLALSPDVKSTVGGVVQDAMSQLATIAEVVANAKEGGEGGQQIDAVPPELEEALRGVADLLMSACETDTDPQPAEGQAAAAPAGPVAMRLSFGKRVQMNKALRELAAISRVEKVGAKMSKDRYTRFQQALSVLTSIAGELAPEVAQNTPAAPVSGEKRAPTAKRDPELVALEKRVTDAEQKASAAEKKAAESQKAAEAAQGELSRLRKGRAGSNTMPVEKGAQAAQDTKFSWPLDMNNPVTRDTVGKGESFME